MKYNKIDKENAKKEILSLLETDNDMIYFCFTPTGCRMITVSDVPEFDKAALWIARMLEYCAKED